MFGQLEFLGCGLGGALWLNDYPVISGTQGLIFIWESHYGAFCGTQHMIFNSGVPLCCLLWDSTLVFYLGSTTLLPFVGLNTYFLPREYHSAAFCGTQVLTFTLEYHSNDLNVRQIGFFGPAAHFACQ